jgi:serine protease Do
MKNMVIGYKKYAIAAGLALALATPFALSLQDNAAPGANTNSVALPSFHQLIQDNVSSVVNIRSNRSNMPTGMQEQMPQLPENLPEQFRRFFEQFPQMPPAPPMAAQGSGFIISKDGYILTNAHVVADADEVYVRLNDNRELQAKVIGSDPRSDVALLKVDADNLPAVKIGDSDTLRIGDWVVAIGSPFGFDYSASQGIVSALGRSLPNGTYVPFIQTDVAVNPGNSGGPLFDLDGNVVGINSQIYSRSGGYQGLSFAIPIKLAMDVAKQIKDEGHVSRGWLGVMIQDIDQGLADSFGLQKPAGALVSQVMGGSPAAKAGVKVGDVIVRYDGRAIERSGELPPLVGLTPVGDKVQIEVLRQGKPLTLNIEIAQLQDEEQPTQLAKADERANARLGVAVSELSAEQRQQLEVSHGVVINNVQPGSAAARAGLRSGDVILSFNNEQVDNPQELAELVKEAPTSKPSVVLIQREQGTLFVPVQLS